MTRATPSIAADQLLLLTDSQANILYASPALCRQAGFSESALIGRPASCLRHPDMPLGPIKDLWATLGRGQSWMGMLKTAGPMDSRSGSTPSSARSWKTARYANTRPSIAKPKTRRSSAPPPSTGHAARADSRRHCAGNG
ncbi:hypothetical protein I0D68_00755 [Pseudomonas lalucatii]|nr:hypothetical protein I0D68_00755 [Pseudomonas lalucatii]